MERSLCNSRRVSLSNQCRLSDGPSHRCKTLVRALGSGVPATNVLPWATERETAPEEQTRVHTGAMCVAQASLWQQFNNGGQDEHSRPGDGIGPLHCRR